MSSSSTPQRTYQAFISYRHADNTLEGRQWATWLHQAIETYQVPDELVGKKNSRGEEIPERIFPIFRDEDELPADADLGNSIANALKASRLLVVVCSPNAVASTYVADEIDYFKRLGHSERIIAMIIDGEPNVSWDTSKHKLGFSAEQECFPEPLQFRYDENGNRTEQRAEPIAADFRVFHDGQPQQAWTSQAAYRQQLKVDGKLAPQDIDNAVKRYGEQQNLMLLKIIAGILGVPLGELTQRDKAYQLALAKQRAKRLRQWLAAVGVLAMVAIGAGIWAYVQQQVAEQQRDTALVSQSRFLLNQAQLRAEDGRFDEAILLGLNALPGEYGGQRPWVNELAGLRLAMQQNQKILSWRAPQAVAYAALIPHVPRLAVGYDNGTVDILEANSGQVLATLAHQARIDQFTISPTGQYIALKGRDSRLTIWSLANFEKINDISMKGWSESVQFNADESAVFSLNYPGYIAKYPINDNTALYETEVVESANRLIISPNSKYLATADLFGMNSHVFDGETGQLIRSIPAEEGAYSGIIREPQFSPLNNEILLVYSHLGTHSYVVTSDEKSFAPGYHLIFDQAGEAGLMLSTGQRIDSGNENADGLNALSTSPMVVDLNSRNYVALEHGMMGPDFVQFGATETIYSGSGDNIYVWNEKTGEQTFAIKIPDSEKTSIDDQQQLILAWQPGAQNVDLYSLQGNQAPAFIANNFQALGRSLSPSGNWLLVINDDNSIGWLNTKTNTVEAVMPIPCERLWRDAQVVFAADETRAAIHCQRDSWFVSQRDTAKALTFQATTVANSGELAAKVVDAGEQIAAQVFDWRNNTQVAEITLPAQSRYDIDGLTIAAGGNYVLANVDSKNTIVANIKNNTVYVDIPLAGEAVWLSEPQLTVVKQVDAITFWRAQQQEPIWRFADGRKYNTVLPIANGRMLLVQTAADELLWLDVASQKIIQTAKLSGYLPRVREYPQHDMFIIHGYQWQSWRMSDHTLIDRSPTFGQSRDIAFDATTGALVQLIDEHRYVRYPALLDLSVKQARAALPIGKNCLSEEQRARYYLPPLTPKQRQQRGCE